MDLTTKQRLFVTYYLGVSAGNATDAARRACYAHPEKLGPRLVGKSSIRAAIDAKLDEASLTSDQILAQLSEIATGGVQHFIEIDDAGRFHVDFKRAKRRGKLGLLKKIKHTEHGVEVEAHDPMRALEMLGKFRGLLNDKQANASDENEVVRGIREIIATGRAGKPGP